MKLIVSTLLMCAIAGAVYLGVIKEDKYVVYAELEDAGGILKNYNVKIGEVPAGEIKDISLTADDDVRLKMELDPDAGPIGEGATAKVRPVNLLGEKYVDLDPGDLAKPVPENTTIPKERTSTPVELDDALNILDPDTRGAMRLIINEFGVAVAGRGSDFNGVLEELPPALDEAEEVVDEVAEENVALREAVEKGDRTLASVTRGKDDLGEMIEAAGDTLDKAASRRAELGATVRNAPGALGQLRETLGGLQRAAVDLTPAAGDLRTATPALADTLSRIPQFTKDAGPALDKLREVSPRLEKLGERSTPTLRRLAPTAARLSQFATTWDPAVRTLGRDSGAKNLYELMDAWTGTTAGRDSLGHFFRLRLTLDETAVTTALDRYVRGLPSAKKKATRKAPAATPAPSAPTPESAPAQRENPVRDLLPRVTEQLDKTLQDVGKTVDGVVKGVTEGVQKIAPKDGSGGSTKKLLDYLLGN